ncbi:TPA: DUF927 domain-containing protein [Pseudomonas aeruginosa]|uniref:DUF927 domain-containing protein n=1 Tax=Pseudomonas aeruginosa TaxID=287 RepID=UPI001C1DD4FB|nr:DUF927 domain-containing protein [Pseudomonas aeruginosa]MBU5955125.1 DUF927 domain-containing protein [Pseudomonas aeruginosa]HCF2498889.1 DUF927 domain-containing protein [Pseudomonas aeruginosa]HCF2903851.1 DUF927 domain-containing protein [Pseudomonas aeruginosa]
MTDTSTFEAEGVTEDTPSSGAAFSGNSVESSQVTKVTTLVPLPVIPEINRPCFRCYDYTQRSGKRSFRAGVWWHTLSEQGAEVDRFVCSPLRVEAITSDGDSDFGRLLRFRNSRGQWREWAMPMAMLRGSGEDMRGELLHLGVEIDPDAYRQLSRYIQEQRPERYVTAATRTGWHGPELFVLPRQNIGRGDAIYQSEATGADDFRAGGTLDGWLDSIARFSPGNPTLLLSLAAAFAGPLLCQLQRTGGGLHWFGDSSTGKSTLLAVAASVWGHSFQFVRSWRVTGNGLEGLAAQRNDTLLALDEIAEVDPREVGSIIYCLANGTGKSRASRTGAARQAKRWRVITLSSGELTSSGHMAEGGRQARTGQEIRLLDLPLKRTFGAWDDLHGMAGGRELSDHLQRATSEHYGHAGPEFVHKLIESGEASNLPAMLGELIPRFGESGGQEGRAAERLAICALAGELATIFGLIPASQGETVAAAVRTVPHLATGSRAWAVRSTKNSRRHRQLHLPPW